MDLAFSILWEELRGEMMKADLYKRKNELIREGKEFRTLLKDKTLTDNISKERVFKLAEEQDKHYKKTMFYSGLLKAMEVKDND
ncbi:MAG: hypothetical protein VZS44_12400 [Bacilli bacterium]|nr:hypothetical protein [Bacilli bacterium]